MVSCKPGTSLQRVGASKGSLSDKVSSLLGWDDVFAVKLPERFSLEIFAGTARVTSMLLQHGFQCYPIDICLSRSHDVLDIGVEHCIINWIMSGRISFIWLGMPYTTFSQARKNDGLGPGPLRSSQHVTGLPNLGWRNWQKVQTGNALLRFTVRIMTMCAQHSVPFALENPRSSFAWDMPPLQNFIRRYQPDFAYLDFCQYEEPWRKPTTIIGKFWPVVQLAKTCNPRFGKCSSTLMPHVPLRGVDASQRFLTLVAQPYPWRLAARVAKLVATAYGVRDQATEFEA